MMDSAALYDALSEEIGTVLIGNEDVVEDLTVSLLTHGHVLLEGVPGVAKTTLANLFAVAVGLDYNRVQMTPDVLPADITGTKIYRQQVGEFDLQLGPVFANVVVADEINRASPKTQAALLEAMQERQVTIEGETIPLPDPFMVVATQNPIEMEGTYQLPKAQRDRFQFKITVDLPDRNTEREILNRFDANPRLGPQTVSKVVTVAEIEAARAEVAAVHVDEKLKEYILDLVGATRDHPDVEHGASPRATLAFLNAGKARAAINDRDYVIPDDVKSLAFGVLPHRLVLTADAELSDVTAAEVVADIVDSVAAPGELAPASGADSAATWDAGED